MENTLNSRKTQKSSPNFISTLFSTGSELGLIFSSDEIYSIMNLNLVNDSSPLSWFPWYLRRMPKIARNFYHSSNETVVPSAIINIIGNQKHDDFKFLSAILVEAIKQQSSAYFWYFSWFQICLWFEGAQWSALSGFPGPSQGAPDAAQWSDRPSVLSHAL